MLTALSLFLFSLYLSYITKECNSFLYSRIFQIYTIYVNLIGESLFYLHFSNLCIRKQAMNKIITTLLGAAVLTGIGYAIERAMSEKADKDDAANKRSIKKAEAKADKAEAKAEEKVVIEEWLKEFSRYDMFRRIYMKTPSDTILPAMLSSRRMLSELMPKDLDERVLLRNCLATDSDVRYLSDENLMDLIREEIALLKDYQEAKKTASN